MNLQLRVYIDFIMIFTDNIYIFCLSAKSNS